MFIKIIISIRFDKKRKFMFEFAQGINNQWVQKSNNTEEKSQKIAKQMMSLPQVWLRQFQNIFLYGCDLQVLHKGKPKQMSLYLDNYRENLLWISSKTKAFILDLYFSSVAYEQVQVLQQMSPKPYYFTLRQFSDEVVLIFDQQSEKNRKFNQFNLYIEHLKKKDPKYCAYFSSISKKHALQATKKGTNSSYTQSDILKFSKQIGLYQTKENEQVLSSCMKYHKDSKKSRIQFECVDEYFKIQFCSRSLQNVYMAYSNEKLSLRETDPRSFLKPSMDLSEFKRFLIQSQKEDDEQKIRLILQSFKEPLSFYDFCCFLYDEKHCSISKDEKIDQSHPLNHYFCYSSHNTYLSGNQLTSDSKVSRYSEDLENGIKCVELDVHNDGGVPIITHAVKDTSLCKEILFEDVIKEIDRFSEQSIIEGQPHYPIILSIENHASQENKDKMLNILTKYFGENIFMLDQNTLEYPPLSYLKGKIVIKTNSKQLELRKLISSDKKTSASDKLAISLEHSINRIATVNKFENKELQANFNSFCQDKRKLDIRKNKFKVRIARIQQLLLPASSMTKITAIFKAPEGIKTVNSSAFECTSLTNSKVMKQDKGKIIDYTKRSWLRTYPVGSQIGSSNYDPVPMLEIGAQIIALNTQTKDSDAWITHGYFSSGRFSPPGIRGYVLKPQRLLPSYKGDSVLPTKPVTKISIQFLQTSGFEIKIKFRGVQKDMEVNKNSTTQFTVSFIDEAFLIFNIGEDYRECCALRFIAEGYRVIQVKNKQNYRDTGERIVALIKKQIL